MAEQIISKRCSKCKQTKQLSEFNKKQGNKDGLRGYCKSCQMVYQREYRQTSKGKTSQREGNKKYSKSLKGKVAKRRYNQSEVGKASQLAQTSRSNARHPNHFKAKLAVNNAVKDGKLPQVSTLFCHYCPNSAQQYHHWHGYEPEHWLDVIPVCIKCHNKQ